MGLIIQKADTGCFKYTIKTIQRRKKDMNNAFREQFECRKRRGYKIQRVKLVLNEIIL